MTGTLSLVYGAWRRGEESDRGQRVALKVISKRAAQGKENLVQTEVRLEALDILVLRVLRDLGLRVRTLS